MPLDLPGDMELHLLPVASGIEAAVFLPLIPQRPVVAGALRTIETRPGFFVQRGILLVKGRVG